MEPKSIKGELIERYFDDDLTVDELKLFNKKLKSDSEFKHKVDLYEQTIGGLLEARNQTIKAQSKHGVNRSQSKNNKRFFSLNKIHYNLIKFICLIFLFVFVFVQTQTSFCSNQDSSQVFKKYFKPYPNVLAPIKESQVESNALSDAMFFYESFQYEDAIFEFDKLLNSNSETYDELLFYKGVSLFTLGNLEAAITNFELMNASSSFENQRKWYLSLALGQLGYTCQAKDLLKEIIFDKSYFMIYSKEILDKLSEQAPPNVKIKVGISKNLLSSPDDTSILFLLP